MSIAGILPLILVAGELDISIREVADQPANQLRILVVGKDNKPVGGAEIILSYRTRSLLGSLTPPTELRGTTNPEGKCLVLGFNHKKHRDITITATHPEHGADKKRLSWKLAPQLMELRPPARPEEPEEAMLPFQPQVVGYVAEMCIRKVRCFDPCTGQYYEREQPYTVCRPVYENVQQWEPALPHPSCLVPAMPECGGWRPSID